MSEGPDKTGNLAKKVDVDGPKKPAKKSWSNPALRAMGIPKLSLPSRNWMIFWGVLAGLAGGIVYDKYEQKQIRKKYMKQVEQLGEEIYDTNRIPRRLTIFIAPPPNDFLDESLKHFRRYIKPILNAAAIDFTVFTETRQGDIRSEVAEKIRQLRRERLEQQAKEEERLRQEAYNKSWTKFFKESVPNAVKSLRKKEEEEPERLVDRHDLYSPKDVLGLYKVIKPISPERDDSKELDLSGGVLCIGRGTYKEYLTGVHEGLLGPLEAPPPPPPEPKQLDEVIEDGGKSEKTEKKEEEIDDFGQKDGVDKDKLPPVPKPYIAPVDYAKAPLAPELNMKGIVRNDSNVPVLFEQPLAVFTVPKLSGVTNIPWKIYRFYTRRNIAEKVSQETLRVVNGHSRPFQYKDKYLGGEEEMDWPKKWIERGKKKNSEWVQELEVDERVIQRMKVFDNKDE